MTQLSNPFSGQHFLIHYVISVLNFCRSPAALFFRCLSVSP